MAKLTSEQRVLLNSLRTAVKQANEHVEDIRMEGRIDYLLGQRLNAVFRLVIWTLKSEIREAYVRRAVKDLRPRDSRYADEFVRKLPADRRIFMEAFWRVIPIQERKS